MFAALTGGYLKRQHFALHIMMIEIQIYSGFNLLYPLLSQSDNLNKENSRTLDKPRKQMSDERVQEVLSLHLLSPCTCTESPHRSHKPLLASYCDRGGVFALYLYATFDISVSIPGRGSPKSPTIPTTTISHPPYPPPDSPLPLHRR